MERRRLAGSPFYPLIPSLPIIFEEIWSAGVPAAPPKYQLSNVMKQQKKILDDEYENLSSVSFHPNIPRIMRLPCVQSCDRCARASYNAGATEY